MKRTAVIASASANRLDSWKRGLSGYACTTCISDSLDKLGNDVTSAKPAVLLLDLDLIGTNGTARLGALCTVSRTIVVGGTISENMEWDFLKAGVRGCCRSEASPEFLGQVADAVLQGELWIRRSLTCRLINELGETTAKFKAHRASLGLLNKLTQRELDIATRVGNGESNKHIAKSCSITERTVKAHLTEIFIKIGVTDRLNLALVMSANDRQNGFRDRAPDIHRTPGTRKSDTPGMMQRPHLATLQTAQ
ncbi:MAG: response regulator transcription factor [Sideroxyarcus sp.]|nr:response regulator transcription factor [Sideroxyarcus sp.]